MANNVELVDGTMRTERDIINRVKDIAEDDFFKWQSNDLLYYVSWDCLLEVRDEKEAKATQAEWAERPAQNLKDEIIEYLPFAWDKANNCRGISSSRSIEHLLAWAWLHSDALYEGLTNVEYEFYGKPQLVFISEAFNVDWKELDNGQWGNDEGFQSNRDEVWVKDWGDE